MVRIGSEAMLNCERHIHLLRYGVQTWNIPHPHGEYGSSSHNFSSQSSSPKMSPVTSTCSSFHVPVSFLFVAHEFYIESADHQEDGDHEEDCWGFKCPPTDPSVYGEPFRSQVLRYTNGRITRAPEYEWINGPPLSESLVRKASSDNNDQRNYATHFDTASVWSCGHPVVVVQCDASKTPTIRRDVSQVNIHAHEYDTFGPKQRWSLLHFRHPDCSPGLRVKCCRRLSGHDKI
jgi:hypothetical protein